MPPTAMKFAKNCIMEWNSNKITDHNRSEVSVAVERIETVKRMANGTMRKYVVADKRTFSVSWSNLPHTAAWAVDGYWAGNEIETFYNSTTGTFPLKITNGDGTTNIYTVFISKFSKVIVKRGSYDFWNVDVELVEA